MTSSCERYVDSIQYGKDQGDIWKFLQRLENQVNRIESKVQDIDSKVRDLQYDAGQRELELIDKIKDLIDDRLKDNNPKNPRWTDFIDELFGLIGGIAGAGALGKLVGGAAALLPFIALGGAGVASFIAGVNNLRISDIQSQLKVIPLIQQQQDRLNGEILALRLNTAISIAQANQKIENLTTKTVEQITKTNNQVSDITGKIIEEIIDTNTQVNINTEKINNVNNSINQINTNQININSRLSDLNANDQNLLNLINNVSSPDLSNFENRLNILESEQNLLKDELNIVDSELKLKIDINSPIPSIKDIENRLKNVETTQNSTNKELGTISGKLTDITPKIELTTDQLQNFNIDNLDNRITKLENGISLVQGQLNGGTINAGNINTGTLNTGTINAGTLNTQKIVSPEIENIKIINNEQTTKITELENMNDTQFNTLQNGLNNLRNTVDFNDNGIKDELITVGGVLAGIGATLLILKNNPASSCRYSDPTPRINTHTTATSAASTAVISGQVQSVNTNLTTFTNTASPFFRWFTNGNWAGKFGQMFNNLVSPLKAAQEIINTALILHNAAMLSRDVGYSVGFILDNIQNAFGIKYYDINGNEQTISSAIGQSLKERFVDMIGGEEKWRTLSLNWFKFSTIYNAAMNTVYAVTGMIQSVQNILDVVGEYTGKIGNALKKAGVVLENSYSWMFTDFNTDTSEGRFSKFFRGIENVQNVTSAVEMVTSDFVSVKDQMDYLKQSNQELNTAINSVVNDTTTAENEAKLESEAPISLNEADLDYYRTLE